MRREAFGRMPCSRTVHGPPPPERPLHVLGMRAVQHVVLGAAAAVVDLLDGVGECETAAQATVRLDGQ